MTLKPTFLSYLREKYSEKCSKSHSYSIQWNYLQKIRNSPEEEKRSNINESNKRIALIRFHNYFAFSKVTR